jgi:hypothetical protein
VGVALGERERGDADTSYAEISQTRYTGTISFGRHPPNAGETKQQAPTG